MSLGRALILKTAAWGPIERMVRRSFLFRPVVRRFIAGDTLDDAMKAAELVCQSGMMASLDYLGENTANEDEAIAATNTYIDMVERIAESPDADKINISIKLTQCGLDQGESFAEKNYRRLLEAAEPNKTFVRVDMEASAYTQRTIEIVERVIADFPNTGTVLQSYLKRSIEDTKRMVELQARVRVVKGAYLEPEEVAFQSKKTVDEKYLEMSTLLLEGGNYPAFATHDPHLIEAIKGHASNHKIDKSRFEFQMLYGIRRDLQESLKKEGYNVRVYIPFGDKWYPYFSRRLAERPANSLFILKALFKR